ncbi:MAG: oligosaccharyl transferase, archaeosortase A system-associated, partial [Archaeoglobaceae archaeon]
ALQQASPMEIAVWETIQRARYGVSSSFSAQEIFSKFLYQELYKSELGIPVDLNATGYVKIFERVKGITVKGRANSDFVEINATIKTNQGRVFEYYQKVSVKDGFYKVTLPYSQDSSYETRPLTPYYFKSNGIVKTIYVKEDQVLKGDEVELDLI